MACVCGHSEEEHPRGGPCEGDEPGIPAGDDSACGCVMYEADDEDEDE